MPDRAGGSSRGTGSRVWRLLGWLLVSALVVLAVLRLDWTRAADVVRSASVPWMGAAILGNGAILLLWAVQWRVLLPAGSAVSGRTMFRITSVMSTMSNGGPPLTGHATGVHLLATWGGVGYAGAASVLALDQLMEGLAKLTLLGVVALATPLPPELRSVVGGLTVTVAVLGGVLLAGAHRRGSWDVPLPWAAQDGVLARGRGFLLRMADNLDALRRPTVALGAFSLALLMKAAELVGILATQAALGTEVGLGGSLLVLAGVGIATMVGVTPGNLGTYEAAAFGIYRWVGVEAEPALALALLQHVLFLIPAAGTGWLLLTLGGGRDGVGSGGIADDP